jgi:hypothetical protein
MSLTVKKLKIRKKVGKIHNNTTILIQNLLKFRFFLLFVCAFLENFLLRVFFFFFFFGRYQKHFHCNFPTRATVTVELGSITASVMLCLPAPCGVRACSGLARAPVM